jgi:hypothetical protein
VAIEVFAQLGLLDNRQLARLASWHHIPTNNALGETIGLSRPEFELILLAQRSRSQEKQNHR